MLFVYTDSRFGVFVPLSVNTLIFLFQRLCQLMCNYEISIHGGWTIDKLMLLSIVSHLKKSTTKGGKNLQQINWRHVTATWGRVKNKGFDTFWILQDASRISRKTKNTWILIFFSCFTFLKIYSNTDLVFEYSVERTNIRIFEYSLTSLILISLEVVLKSGLYNTEQNYLSSM